MGLQSEEMRRKYGMPENELLAFIIKRGKRTNGSMATPCLEWTGHKSKRGYGVIRFRRKVWRTHRVCWTLAIGEIPDQLEVCHACDNPSCFEIGHLFVGTHGDNMRDAEVKERVPHPIGEDHPGAKLSDGQIREIKSLYKRGPYFRGKLTAEEVGARFGICKNMVYLITSNRNWSHII